VEGSSGIRSSEIRRRYSSFASRSSSAARAPAPSAFYVIHNPALASQQSGSNRIIKDLLTWHVDEPEYLLPPDRLEEVEKHQSVLRGCCDHISSLTERQATLLYRRMSGISLGSITDRLHF
jgi:dGTP triphosphohydrolase